MSFIWRDDDPDKKSKTPDEIWQKQNEFWRNQIGPVDAVKISFLRIFDYRGRSSRPEFWWFIVFSSLVNAFSYQISNRIFIFFLGKDDVNGILVLSILSSVIIAMAIFIVWLPLAIRRVRDAGKSPFWIASYIVPFALIFGADAIKDEYQNAFLGLYIMISSIVVFGMLVIYLMPSKGVQR